METKKGNISDILKSTIWVSKFLFKFSPGLFIATFITQIVTSVAPFLRTKIFSDLIDSLTSGVQNSWINIFIWFMVVGLITSLFFFLQGQLNRILDIRLQAHLRKTFIAKVAHLDYPHFEPKESSSLSSEVDE